MKIRNYDNVCKVVTMTAYEQVAMVTVYEQVVLMTAYEKS